MFEMIALGQLEEGIEVLGSPVGIDDDGLDDDGTDDEGTEDDGSDEGV